eukprot:m.82361 g.82361  ORF g.82361 m.82361 type:complete len:172 (-) comp16325_c0_seq7:424-939(-)
MCLIVHARFEQCMASVGDLLVRILDMSCVPCTDQEPSGSKAWIAAVVVVLVFIIVLVGVVYLRNVRIKNEPPPSAAGVNNLSNEGFVAINHHNNTSITDPEAFENKPTAPPPHPPMATTDSTPTFHAPPPPERPLRPPVAALEAPRPAPRETAVVPNASDASMRTPVPAPR